ncbi:HAD-IA family hydrolase [Pullulanibacillus pueri]|uniref:Uncharacterized protein n=2 Tax=Pullulanibacillus pueri TaxID=1437324 RepID=A0A8J2ZYR4_9BACL|nr:HAD-IA family hydrolase [Pullulanibacillus pueri]GGH87260.1 hypothetical protein GCM10007096_36870 [Pullulanibacillus pueri]
MTNLSPRFWSELSRKCDVPINALHTFKTYIREDRWTGRLTEVAFWKHLCEAFPSIQKERAKRILLETLRPLPALEMIPHWSRYASIHLLSNHRGEWIRPLLTPVMPYLTSVTISSEAGSCKPSPEIYQKVMQQLCGHHPIVFIDDQVKNLKIAKTFGWHIMLADEEGKWVRRTSALLKSIEKVRGEKNIARNHKN